MVDSRLDSIALHIARENFQAKIWLQADRAHVSNVIMKIMFQVTELVEDTSNIMTVIASMTTKLWRFI